MPETDQQTKPLDEGGVASAAHCSDSWIDHMEEHDRMFCHFCGGEGMVEGSDMGDPLWHDPDQFHQCPCCNGSGDAADCTFW